MTHDPVAGGAKDPTGIGMCLRGRISVGLPAIVDYDGFRSVLDEYADYLAELYFSPPVPVAAYHTRTKLFMRYLDMEAQEDGWKQLAYARSRGVRLEFALNAGGDDGLAVKACELVAERLGAPDSVVCIDRLAHIARAAFPSARFVYSYNNGIRTARDILDIPVSYDELVLGGAYIRRRDLFALARSRGLAVRFLVNNGCSFNCHWCADSRECAPTFARNLELYGVEALYALQSILPEELYSRYDPNDFDLLKISSRPSSLHDFRAMLRGYATGSSAMDGAEAKPHDWALWARLSHFGPYLENLDYGRVMALKDDIWAGRLFQGTVA